MNWSRYSKPWDVIFDHHGFGITQIFVRDLPGRLPEKVMSGANSYDLKVEHEPEPENYSHSEIHAYKDGKRSDGVSNTVKKEYRTMICERTLILQFPEDK